MEMFDYGRFESTAKTEADTFAKADPFPHVVIDDFLPPDAARAVLAEFDDTMGGWNHYHHYNEKKLALTDVERMGPATRALFDVLQSPRFVEMVGTLSGIDGLISDPALDGAGLHRINRGGFLNVHTDFLSHTKNTHWSRQINLLLYLNPEWDEAWQGNLELWDEDMRHCVRSIAPVFNRCVIFNTRERSFHGHPEKLACPDGVSRKSIALYYFRDEGAERDLSPTNYRARPADSALKRALIVGDRMLLRAYSRVKRHTGLTDEHIDRILRRF